MKSHEGVEARKAALRLLDAVLRRGQTMDNAAQAARGLPPADAALASAIAGETLRRLPDLHGNISNPRPQVVTAQPVHHVMVELPRACCSC